MATLRQVIPALHEQGYRLVTLDELLETGTPIRAVTRPWLWQDGFACPDPYGRPRQRVVSAGCQPQRPAP